MPQYTKDAVKNSTLLYFNKSSGVWRLGDKNHTDYIFNMSVSSQVSPVHWAEWNNEGSLETPVLLINDPSSLPPYIATLQGPGYGDPFYDGTYTLNLYTLYNSLPQYSKSDGKLLYLAQFTDFSVWLINNGSRQVEGTIGGDNGHPLSRVPDSSFSPYFWDEWDNTGTIESPTLKLKNPDLLAPSVELLSSSNATRQVFFQGIYTLNFPGYEGHTQYTRTDPHLDPQAVLYVVNDTWVFGFEDHPYSYLNLSKTSEYRFMDPPAMWKEWSIQGSRTEKPSLTITNSSAAYLPSSMILTYLQLPSKQFFGGNYTIDVTAMNNNFPQYINNENRLYVNEYGVWMFGEGVRDVDNSKPVSFTKAFNELTNYPEQSERAAKHPTADSPLAWEEWSSSSEGIQLSPQLQLSDTNVLYEFRVHPYHVCLDEDGDILDMNMNPAKYCNTVGNCRETDLGSADEEFEDDNGETLNRCPFYVNPQFWLPFLMAAGFCIIGLAFFFFAGFCIGNSDKDRQITALSKSEMANANRVDIVIKTLAEHFLKTEKMDATTKADMSEHVSFLHDTPGGMFLLIQTAFIYCVDLDSVEMKRQFSLFLWSEEEKIHKDQNMKEILRCIRKKGGSNPATGFYLDHKLTPELKKFDLHEWYGAKWKVVEDKLERFVEWLKEKEDKASNVTKPFFICGRKVIWVFSWIKKLLIIPFIVVLIMLEATEFEFDGLLSMELYCFILDMVKDTLFWLYLTSRQKFLPQNSLTIALIWLQFATIFVAQVLMGFFIILNADKVFNFRGGKCRKIITYFLLVVFSPFLPCSVVMKVNSLEAKKAKFMEENYDEHRPGIISKLRKVPVRTWRQEVSKHREQRKSRRKKQESPATICLKCREIDQQSVVLRSIASSFIVVEGTLESIPQLMILLVFLFSHDDSYNDSLVVVGDSMFIFYLNTFLSIFSVIAATISYSNVMKKEQLGFYQKMILALSASCQILSKLLPMIAISTYTTRTHNDPKSMIALLLPILIHWIFISIMYFSIPSLRVLVLSKENSLKDTIANFMLHIISNTFLAVPLRDLKTEDLRHKGYELIVILAITGIEVVCLFFLGFGLFWNTESTMITALWIASPVCFAWGCIFLLAYYQCAHTWRYIDKEQMPFFTWLCSKPSNDPSFQDNPHQSPTPQLTSSPQENRAYIPDLTETPDQWTIAPEISDQDWTSDNWEDVNDAVYEKEIQVSIIQEAASDTDSGIVPEVVILSKEELPPSYSQSMDFSEEEEENLTTKEIAQLQSEMLAAHNRLRVLHGVAPLNLSTEICSQAQSLAEAMVTEDRYQLSSTAYGANIMISSIQTVSGEVPVSLWYSEGEHFTFSSESWLSRTGNFSQVLWRATKELGVGWARNPATGKMVVLALYSPPGNTGSFADNVPPLLPDSAC